MVCLYIFNKAEAFFSAVPVPFLTFQHSDREQQMESLGFLSPLVITSREFNNIPLITYKQFYKSAIKQELPCYKSPFYRVQIMSGIYIDMDTKQ